MKLIPSVLIREKFPKGRTTSKGEIKIFNALKSTEGYGGWYCLHSLDLPEHEYKSSGEIDFLLVGPGGIYALEIKGGDVSFKDGIWDYGYKRKKESPFQQAESAIRALLKRINENRINGLSQKNFYWGYGVIFTSIQFNIESSAWDKEVILDEYQIFNNPYYMEKYLDRLIIYWQQHHGKCNLLSDEDVRSLVNYFRPSFEKIATLRLSVEEVEGAFVDLTNEQYQCLDAMAENDRVIFDGGAGTGKTFVAIEEARRKCSEGKSVLFLCFNPVLAEYLNHNLTDERLKITSVHALFFDTLENKSDFDRHPVLKELNSEKYIFKLPEMVLDQISIGDSEKYDVIIIDEAQDLLSENYIMIIDYFLKGGFEKGVWRIFIDSRNQKGVLGIFEESAYKSLRNISQGVYRLNRNVRNTRQIVNDTKLWTGLDFSSVSPVSGPEIKIHYYSDRTDHINQMKDLVKEIVSESLQPGYLTFLSTVPLKESVVSEECFRRYRIREIDRSRILDFPFNSYTYSMIADFKGLENSVIVVTDIDEGSLNQPELFYVAFTRTRYSLHVFIPSRLRVNLEKNIAENRTKLKGALNES